MPLRVVGKRAVPKPSPSVEFPGPLYLAWREARDNGYFPSDEEYAAAADEVLRAWEHVEDRQIPLDPANPKDANFILVTQQRRDDAADHVRMLSPAASAVYAHLVAVMPEYVAAVDARLRAPVPHLLFIVRAPNPDWYAEMHSAVGAWVMAREAALSITPVDMKLEHPDSTLGSHKKSPRSIDAGRVLKYLPKRHVIVCHHEEVLPDILHTVADVCLDLGGTIPPSLFADVVAGRFAGRRPDWPEDLGAHRFRPDALEMALVRACEPDDVWELLEAITIGEGIEAAREAADAADKAAKSVAKSAVSYPSSPVLADLSGYGTARVWGESLAADLADYRSKKIGWEDVDAGCLLHGPPGTGKTLFASALAATCGVPFLATSYADWQAKDGGHAGDVVKAIQTVFETANKNAPCIVFIDEIDTVPARGGGHRYDDWWGMITSALLECLDGTKRREGVVVVAACNYPHRLDPALVRSGRLDRRFSIELPDEAALAGILAHHLPGIDGAVLEPVATTLAGTTSGADAARIAREARRIARRAKRDLVGADLLAVAMPADTRPYDVRRRIAVHESGHAVALLSQGRLPVSLSLVEADGSGARVVSEGPAGGLSLLGDVERQVVVCLAGRAAEEVLLGQPSVGAGGASGAGSDLERATSLLAASQSVLGLGGYLVHGLGADGAVVEERLRRLYAETLLLIGRHRASVERLALLALDRRVLGRKALAAFAADEKMEVRS